jgi:hypothetical protein
VLENGGAQLRERAPPVTDAVLLVRRGLPERHAEPAAGKPYAVRVLTMPGLSFVSQSTGTTTGGSSISYAITGVPAGRYFLLAFVDVDGSGGDSSTPGDYAGWYGHGGDDNPPASPNVEVPASGTVRFDFSLVVR